MAKQKSQTVFRAIDSPTIAHAPGVPVEVKRVANRQLPLDVALKVALLALAVIGALRLYGLNTRPQEADPNPVPIELRQQLPFSPLVIPNGNTNFTTSDYKLSKAENSVDILSYMIQYQGRAISVSVYSQPPEFNDIPEYKDRFLTNVVRKYDSVQTANGTIHLGRLSKQKKLQLGVMLESGLLVFMSPDKNLKKAQWRAIGDQLEIQKQN